MNIFNSLGSNYNLDFVLQTIFSSNNQKYKKDLEDYLSEKFTGKTTLTYKGRQAIEIALKTLNLPKDTYVAINGFTCYAVYKAITDAGLKPEYIDIAEGDLNFSPQQLNETISKNPKIKVVIVQNTLGYPAKLEEISQICKKNKIILIEDLAHSIGGKYGDFVTLSFSQDKLLDAVSGGALIIRNNKYNFDPQKLEQKNYLKDRLYPLFTYLIRTTYSFGLGKVIHTFLKSLNLLSQPMDDKGADTVAPWYCQLAREQLNSLEKNIDHRKKIASIYAENIDKKVLSPILVKEISNSTNLRFPVFVENRTDLTRFLKNKGIFVSDIWYDAPIAPKKYMSKTNYNGECPNAQKVSEKILNLPTHKNTSEKDAEKISQLINQWLKL